MATTIKLKNGSGAPLAADLVQGEPAFDLTNKRLYTENASGTVIEIGTSPSTIDINAGTIDGTVIGGASAAAGTFTTLNATGGGSLTGTWSDLGSVTTVDINGGTIDGVTIGGASAGAGTFTTITGSGDMAIDTDTLFVDVSTDRVGVNTSTPSTALHVNGLDATLTLSGTRGSGGTHSIGCSGTNNTNLVFLVPNELRMFTDSNKERLNISSGGDISFYEDTGTTPKLFWDASAESLGIGTTSPSSFNGAANNLVVGSGSGSEGITVYSQNNAYGSLYFADGTTGAEQYAGWIDYNHNTNFMRLATNGAERLRIDSSGNVGIGTTSPNAKLDILATTNTIRLGRSTSSYATIDSNSDAGSLNFNADAGNIAGGGSMTFNFAGSERMRIDSAGNVGIGTSSPAGRFHVLSGSDEPLIWGSTNATYNYATIRHHSSGDIAYYGACGGAAMTAGSSSDFGLRANQGAMLFATNGNNERMRITSAGNVGIGTTSPISQLSVVGANSGFEVNGDSGSSNARLLAYDRSASAYRQMDFNALQHVFSTSNSERMRLDSSGNLLVGTTSLNANGRVFNVKANLVLGSFYRNTSITNDGVIEVRSDVGGTNTVTFQVDADGDVNNTNNSYGAISDERFKSNIVDAPSQIEDIMSVKVRSYTLNSTGDKHIGVVAQELETSGMSGLVSENQEGTKSVKYSVLYMKALKALQEAVERIETLETTQANLIARIETLEGN